jgi:hypothetical protein
VATDRVLDLYVRGVDACRRADQREAMSIVKELMDNLDLDFGDAASGLFRLYDEAFRHLRNARFARALVVLTALRDAYAGVSVPVSLPS